MWTNINKTEVEYKQTFTNLTRIAGLNLEQVVELSYSCKFFSNKALIQDWKSCMEQDCCGGTIEKGAWTNPRDRVNFFSWLAKENNSVLGQTRDFPLI